MKQKNIIAVVRFDEKSASLDFSDACIEGGIDLLEVITIRKNSFEVIGELSGRKRPDHAERTCGLAASGVDRHSSRSDVFVHL